MKLPGSETPLPSLRAVELVPFTAEDGEPYFALRDPLQLHDQTMAVSAIGCFILAHLDGRRTLAEVRQAFRAHTRMTLPDEHVARLLAALDGALLLDNGRAQQAIAARHAAYQAAPARDNRDRFPPADQLRAELEAILGQAPGVDRAAVALRGVVAPHLDTARGAPCYAAAYGAVAAAPPAERYIVVGTNHGGQSRAVVATRKPFRTPLGEVPVDTEFMARVERRLQGSDRALDLCANEVDHQHEHSIELQVHFLQVIAGGRPFQLVPVLCPDVCGPTATAPSDGRGPDLGEFAAAVGAEIAADGVRTILIAGADLSHVGQRFGDPQPTTPEFLAAVEQSDGALLEYLVRDDLGEYLAALHRHENATRVCSTGCLYALRRALPGREWRVLRYHQAVDMDAETHVTCAAALVL